MKRDTERITRDFDNLKSALDAATKEKDRYSKESLIAHRKISDFEMLVQRVQEENMLLKKDLNSSHNKMNSLQKVVDRATANHSKVVNEANMYRENATRLENEVLIVKEEATNFQSQVGPFLKDPLG